eukprot:Blabericola_migrator_1__11321@NODE_668_length_6963_cov_352_794519_g487_i0_p3_GENE_NODE_668_length_6963_cov_352_794519_g487_i0NODE_668_length_6963_cov_352_794519_g487_i0_p3_ORF_typecomplete_len194_score37_96zfLYAR/PF08790_11/5_1e03zfLYAR/PF08790_11/6_4e12Astro_capsid_p/PF12226_8/6AspBHydro_N/PF05279_11/10_NODE_668_length_6963_cov_352_794519_g487_i043784959
MVSFICGNCQDTVKKAAVNRHCETRCPNANVFTCIDCLTSFEGWDFEQHTSCISEREKYGPKKVSQEKEPPLKKLKTTEGPQASSQEDADAIVPNLEHDERKFRREQKRARRAERAEKSEGESREKFDESELRERSKKKDECQQHEGEQCEKCEKKLGRHILKKEGKQEEEEEKKTNRRKDRCKKHRSRSERE